MHLLKVDPANLSSSHALITSTFSRVASKGRDPGLSGGELCFKQPQAATPSSSLMVAAF